MEEVTVYGSVVEGEKRVRDLDLYIQLDRESVSEEDLLQEVFGGHGRGAGTRLTDGTCIKMIMAGRSISSSIKPLALFLTIPDVLCIEW